MAACSLGAEATPTLDANAFAKSGWPWRLPLEAALHLGCEPKSTPVSASLPFLLGMTTKQGIRIPRWQINIIGAFSADALPNKIKQCFMGLNVALKV